MCQKEPFSTSSFGGMWINKNYSKYGKGITYHRGFDDDSEGIDLDDTLEEEPSTGSSKRIPFYLILIFPLLISVAFYLLYPSYKSSNVLSETDIKYYSTSYYIVQTHFKTLENSINLEAISDREVYLSSNISENELAELADILHLDNYGLIEPTFGSLSEKGEKALLISYFHESDLRLKNLDVDGYSLWDKEFDLNDYPLKTQTLIGPEDFVALAETPEFAREKVTTLFVGGEMIPARAVDRLWINESNDSDFLFDRVKNQIISADIALSMLENSYLGDPVPCRGCTTFVSDERVLETYKNVGFDVLSLAGNHEGDGGDVAAQKTRELLDRLGIKHFGSGNNIAEASDFVTIESNGTKFAFLGADDVAYFNWAGEEREGTNTYSKVTNSVLDTEKIKRDIGAAKEAADIVVVFMSWGIEYQNYAFDYHKKMAQAFTDAGADLVVGSHPHWVQNIEFQKTNENFVPVVYSLGNFIFDQTHTQETREGMLSNFIFFDGRLVDIEFTPILNCGYHQTSNNLAGKVVSGELNYDDVDGFSESEGCVWWQPKPLDVQHSRYDDIFNRMWEHTEL